jgi:tetratricopeptide (TPR) repeat protein
MVQKNLNGGNLTMENNISDGTWGKKLKDRLNDFPENGELWIEYGDFLLDECDNPLKTIEAYEKAADLLKGKDVRLRLGLAYDRAGQPEKGISIIIESLNDNARSNGYCILADIYLKNDMFKKAQSACKKALEIDSNFEEAYYLLGEALKRESPEKAIECFRKALDLDPKYQLSWQALGRVLAGTKEGIREGITALRKAIELDPDDGWAQIYLANALWKIGDIKEAEKWYKSAIEIYPELPELRKWYEQFLNSTNKK